MGRASTRDGGRYKKIARGEHRQEIDWIELYWRLRYYFPHAPEFNQDNFAFQPVNIITQALEYGAKFKQEEYHYHELGIATLNASFINANRDPKKGSPAKPSDFFYFQPTNKDFNSAIANTVLELAAKSKLPGWTLSVLPINDLIKLKTGLSNNTPKALIGNDVFIVNPTIAEDKIYYGLAVLGENKGQLTVKDCDTGKKYTLLIPDHDDYCMILDDYFNLVT